MPTSHTIAKEIIHYLKEQGLYELLPEVVHELEAEVYRNHDITILSAAELTHAEKENLEKTLTKKWGEHRFMYSLDPSLLSGILIRFRDQLIDMSGKFKLSELGEALKS